MSIKAQEISKIIKEKIQGAEVKTDISETGTILTVGDGIAHIHGLENIQAGELVELPHGVKGLALNLEEDNVGVVLLGNDTLIREVISQKEPEKSRKFP